MANELSSAHYNLSLHRPQPEASLPHDHELTVRLAGPELRDIDPLSFLTREGNIRGTLHRLHEARQLDALAWALSHAPLTRQELLIVLMNIAWDAPGFALAALIRALQLVDDGADLIYLLGRSIYAVTPTLDSEEFLLAMRAIDPRLLTPAARDVIKLIERGQIHRHETHAPNGETWSAADKYRLGAAAARELLEKFPDTDYVRFELPGGGTITLHELRAMPHHAVHHPRASEHAQSEGSLPVAQQLTYREPAQV